MAIYVFFVVLWKYLHADVRRAARLYRMLFLAGLVAFAVFMIVIDIRDYRNG